MRAEPQQNAGNGYAARRREPKYIILLDLLLLMVFFLLIQNNEFNIRINFAGGRLPQSADVAVRSGAWYVYASGEKQGDGVPNTTDILIVTCPFCRGRAAAPYADREVYAVLSPPLSLQVKDIVFRECNIERNCDLRIVVSDRGAEIVRKSS